MSTHVRSSICCPLLTNFCLHFWITLGRVGQSVTCLATDASLIADQGVASSIPARSHTFVEIDHEIQSFSSLPLNHSRRVVVSFKRKYVHEVLVNCLFKLAQEKVVTIANDLRRKATKYLDHHLLFCMYGSPLISYSIMV